MSRSKEAKKYVTSRRNFEKCGAKHSLSILTLTLSVGRANMASEAFDVSGCGSDLPPARPPSIETRSRNASKYYQRLS